MAADCGAGPELLAPGINLGSRVKKCAYCRYLLYGFKAAPVLHVWETAQQDLVRAGFIPQGEAHPELCLQGLHSDIGVPQAACRGHRCGWE